MTFCGNCRGFRITMNNGANTQSIVMIGCCCTALIIEGCDMANAAPRQVMMTPRKTTPYVRRTSVARSVPDRTGMAWANEGIVIDRAGLSMPFNIHRGGVRVRGLPPFASRVGGVESALANVD